MNVIKRCNVLLLTLISMMFMQSAFAHGKLLDRETNDGFPVAKYLRGTPLVASPWLGERSAYDGTDFLVLISSINQGLRILQQQQQLENLYIKHNRQLPSGPAVDVSGRIELVGNYSSPYANRSNGSFELDTAELDIIADISTWATSYVSIKYDSAPTPAPFRVRSRQFYSNVFVDKAFGVIGNLNRCPVYFTAGQLVVPFGQFSSMAVTSNPLTASFLTKVRGGILGFQQTPSNIFFNGAVFIYHGDNSARGRVQGGFNVNMKFANETMTGQLGVSATSNVAEGRGFQTTANVAASAVFGGFAAIRTDVVGGSGNYYNHLARRVTGVSVQGKMRLGQFNFIAEYITALSRFALSDLTHNGRGARPSAFNGEIGYDFTFSGGRPASVMFGYGFTHDMLALALAKQQFVLSARASFWRYTITGIDVNHSLNYPGSNAATGKTIGAIANPRALGKSSTTVSLYQGFYF